MLTQQEIEQNLFRSAETFLELMRKKEYVRAKICYTKARTVAVAVALDPDKMDRLFGSRQVDPPVEGAFPEELVLKAMEKCFSIEKESEETEAELRRIQHGRKTGRQVMEEQRRRFWENQESGRQMVEEQHCRLRENQGSGRQKIEELRRKWQ